MEPKIFDIAIIGAGCIGASIFSGLKRATPASVLLIDAIGAAAGATGACGGLLRVFYESETLSQLAIRSLLRYRTLESFTEMGCLYFLESPAPSNLEARISELKTWGLDAEYIGSLEGQKRFPDFDWAGKSAVYEPKAARIDPRKTTEAWVADGIGNGGQILFGTRVCRAESSEDTWKLRTSNGPIRARIIVLASGAGIPSLLAQLGINLPMSLRTHTTETWEQLNPEPGTTLNSVSFFDRTSLSYGYVHSTEGRTTWMRGGPSPEVRLPPLAKKGEKTMINTATEAYSPDREGFLGFIPGHPSLYIASGWGGTAFKLAPAIAEDAVPQILEASRLKIASPLVGGSHVVA